MSRGRLVLIVRGGSALLAGVLGFTLAMNLVDTEAGGGRLTGPLIWMCLVGSLVLLVCAALVFARPAVVGVLVLVGALACVPLFVYRIAPSLLSWASDVPASVVADRVVTFDPMAVGGLVAIGILAVTYARLPVRGG